VFRGSLSILPRGILTGAAFVYERRGRGIFPKQSQDNDEIIVLNLDCFTAAEPRVSYAAGFNAK